MNRPVGIRWSGILTEGTAIVVSILIAFSIQAWWDDRQQKADEHVIMQALLDDLVKKKAMLASDRIFNDAILNACVTLVRGTDEFGRKLNPKTVDQLTGEVWWYNSSSTWESAPMNSLIAGGDLGVISNSSLLQKISELQVAIGNIQEVYKNDEVFHQDAVTPFLIQNVHLPQITNTVEHFPGQPEIAYEFPDFEKPIVDHSVLLDNSEFQNLLIARINRLLDIKTNAHAGTDDKLDEVIMMLRDELD